MRPAVPLLGAALLVALAGGCALDCELHDVLRVELAPIDAIAPGEARIWTRGAGGLDWPSGLPPPTEAAALTAALIRGEAAAGGTLRITAVLETERLFYLDLPAAATSTAGARLAIAAIVEGVAFTGGYGSRYGWWDDAWRRLEEARPPSASVVAPFDQMWSARTSTGTVEVRSVAPLVLRIDVTTAQGDGRSERVRAEVRFSLEEDREVCAR